MPLSLPSRHVDLGDYDPDFAGWMVVFDRNFLQQPTPREGVAEENDESGRMLLLKSFLGRVLVAWNFIDADGTPVPQPREGGLDYCPQVLIRPIIQAFEDTVITPEMERILWRLMPRVSRILRDLLRSYKSQLN